METRQLEYFVAVAEELNFTRAAARLFAVQSTVSAGVRALETDLGSPLFLRSTKRVTLTPMGEALLPEARAAIEAIDRVRTTAAQARSGIRGRLRVGTFANLEIVDLPRLFGEFHRLYPLVDLQLGASPSGSTGLREDVRLGRVDVAFMGLPAEELGEFAVLELSKSPLIAVLPVGHPLATGAPVALADLVVEPFVDVPAGFGSRVATERTLAAAGLTRTVSTEIGDLGGISRFVAARLGVAIVPENMYVPAEGALALPLAGPRVTWLFSAISRRSSSPAVEALLGLLAEAVMARAQPE